MHRSCRREREAHPAAQVRGPGLDISELALETRNRC